jgi:hypothetical protein
LTHGEANIVAEEGISPIGVTQEESSMKAVILAGGPRIRLSEETAEIRPKPMVEIGGKPDSL